VRPKLFDLDSEKLARLFADLRRESAATGSFPITVRHLESMIRMAEASARMSLREYVRADDIDLAISVAIESFVNAQKMSIKKTLQRVRFSPCALLSFRVPHLITRAQGFRKYLTQARDHEELLAFLLGQIVKEKARFFQLQRHRQPELVTVAIAELDERVRFERRTGCRMLISLSLSRTGEGTRDLRHGAVHAVPPVYRERLHAERRRH
jgi:DNA replication licensing factor MCM2